jgi:hypothetical protein
MQMMRNWGVVVAASVLALAACQPAVQSRKTQSPPTESQTKAAASAALPAPSPVSLHRFTLDAGDYVHAQTGFRFPAQAGALVRKAIIEYTANRDDVSVDYDLPGPSKQIFHVSAYVFPIWNMAGRRLTTADIPNACASAYTYAQDQLKQYTVNPRLFRDAPISPGRFADAALHMVALYDADGMVKLAKPIRTSLYFHCAVDRVWVVMYRVTRSSNFAADAKVQELMNLVPIKPAS